MNKVLMISLLGIGFTLTACTPMTPRPKPSSGQETVSTSVDVDQRLTDVACAVQDSLRTLAASKEPYIQNAINTDPLVTPEGGMGIRTTLDWSGPIEPLLYELAHMSRYDVKVLGPSPAIPVVVTVMGEQRCIADLIKDAGLQAARRANVVVYPASRIIELRYIPA